MLLSFAEAFRDALLPFLIGGTALLLLMLALLVVQRLLRAAAAARRAAVEQRCAPLIDAALSSDAPGALAAAAGLPRRHRYIAAALIQARLRLVRGREVERAAVVADRMGLTRKWRGQLDQRRWWQRADSAVALGLVRDRASVGSLIRLLDDEHEQVRAAAIDALGLIRDPLAVPALLQRMSDPTRHERTRVVQALRAYGEPAVDALIDHGRRHPQDRALVAHILSFIGGSAAAEPLLEWAIDGTNPTRAAAWSALAATGLDARAYYHAVKALGAGVADVRAAAARALARSGRADAAPHLAERLDDEWDVAAQAARSLARLGPDGLAALQARVDRGPGPGHDLARQVLWESHR